MEKEIIGRCDCPYCGTVAGMRFTRDKNGKPFGYCEAECRGQLRVGGDARREKLFAARHAWASQKPVTVTDQQPKPELPVLPVTVTEPKKKKITIKPVPVPEQIQPKKAHWTDSLSAGLGALGIAT